ncbi:hypothetical protein TELCIR_02338 [Teladorsagia circumcincta]|uniref:Uncharacterized protein n=1 Tax=Teladorsagia circumcincta TaxID=45464 RepID=A0A2G9UZD6_TELCI|nr:hypothetical protein TELCIR_02338 [Teladorsagia circumcincta]
MCTRTPSVALNIRINHAQRSHPLRSALQT